MHCSTGEFRTKNISSGERFEFFSREGGNNLANYSVLSYVIGYCIEYFV